MSGPIPPKPSTVRQRAKSRRRRKKNRYASAPYYKKAVPGQPKPWLAKQLRGG